MALFMKTSIDFSMVSLFDPINSPAGPGMHRLIHIGKFPLVSRNLPIGVLELFEQEQPEIVLGKVWVNQRKRNALEGQIPRCKPRKLPFVGHGENPHGVQMAPASVAAVLARIGRRPMW